MTREQIIKTYMINSKKVIAEMLHDTIEKYEGRTCENCKHYTKKILFCSEMVSQQGYTYPDFGCNKFEGKDNE